MAIWTIDSAVLCLWRAGSHGVLVDASVAAPAIAVEAPPDYKGRTSQCWVQRLTFAEDEDAVLLTEGGMTRKFVDVFRHRKSYGPPQRLYEALPAGAYAVGVGQLRRWVLVGDDGRVASWCETRDELRSQLGLPPLDTDSERVVEQMERAYDLPTLGGTEKQIAYARRIRALVATKCPAELGPMLGRILSASVWIDGRATISADERIASCAWWSATRPGPDGDAERVGRVLADLLYAAREPHGEVLRDHVTEPPIFRARERGSLGLSTLYRRLRANFFGVEKKLDADTPTSRGVDVDALLAAYRARWQELLASSTAVMVVDTEDES